MIRRAIAGAATVALCAAVPGFGAPAEAGVVGCGQLVTTDIVLDADLGPCPGHGLEVINRTGLTIDLNGHRIVGTGDINNTSSGIRVVVSRRITIKNGTVTRFARGVDFGGVQESLITGMELIDNTGALFPGGSGVSHGGSGIQLDASHENRVRSNRIIHNGPTGGVVLFESGGNVFEGNLIQANDVRQLESDHTDEVTQVARGIWIYGLPFLPRPHQRTGHNIVRNNQVIGNGWHGILIELLSSDNVVVGNHVVGNGHDQPANLRVATYGDGIHIAARANNLVEGNLVTRNGGHGIALAQRGNTVRRNTSVFNAQRPNILPGYDLYNNVFGCPENTWSQNVFRTFSHPCVTA